MTRFTTGLGLAVLVALGGAAAGQEREPVDPAKLVGRWEPVEPKKEGTTVVVFAAGGKFALTTGVGGKTETWPGTYAVAGRKLKLTLRIGEKMVTEEVTVFKLTADEFETEDARGKKESLRRVGP